MKNNTNIESRVEMEKRFDDEFASKDPEFSDCFADVGSIIGTDDVKSFITTTRLSDIDELKERALELKEPCEECENGEFHDTPHNLLVDNFLTLLDQYKQRIQG